MPVTAELLRTKIKELSVQRDNALATHQQATGAIILAEHLLDLLQQNPSEDSMSLDDFAKSLGGESAEIVENTSDG